MLYLLDGLLPVLIPPDLLSSILTWSLLYIWRATPVYFLFYLLGALISIVYFESVCFLVDMFLIYNKHLHLIFYSISWVTHFNCRVNMTCNYFLFIFERLTDYYDFVDCFSSWFNYCLFFCSFFILGYCWLIDLDMVDSVLLHFCLFLMQNLFFPVLLWLRLFSNSLCLGFL